MDRESWGDGPWVSEPDAIFWTEACLPCLVLRGHFGQLNGYVGVAYDHPYFGRDYGEVEDIESVGAHGGLTYAGLLDAVPLPFRVHRHRRNQSANYHARVQKKWTKRWSVSALNRWWYGFDCAHASDFTPGLHAVTRMIEPTMPPHLRDLRKHLPLEIYRDVDYVREQVTQFASQLVPVEPATRSSHMAERMGRSRLKQASAAHRARLLSQRERMRSVAADLRARRADC